MAKEKQYVFSARTSEEGLKQLGDLKNKLNLSWDELVINGMCNHYNLDKAVLQLPKKKATKKVELANNVKQELPKAAKGTAKKNK